MLLAADAEANIANAEGRTPLHLAAGSHDNPGGVAALLAAGADPCIRDGQGFIPYSVAAEGGRIHRALSRAGGYDRACDEQGEAVSLDSDEQRRIQSALAARGFDPGPADGKFGPRTRRAIQAWQRANGYSATGDLTREQAEMLLTESVVADEVSPKCTGAAKGDKCWKRVADRPGCHVWVTHFHPGQTVSWSGPCSAGIAEGRGELVWTTDGNSVQQTGTLSNGRKHGDWVLSYNGGNENVACVVPELKQGYETDRRFALEGPFENGKAQGQWTVRGCLVVQYDSGQQYLPYTDEGPVVNGQRHGNWTKRWRGTRGYEEGSYVRGKKQGVWVHETFGEYATFAEFPYVDGKRHGRAKIRGKDQNGRDDGICWVEVYSRGEQVGDDAPC